jgi:hypothetical protein
MKPPAIPRFRDSRFRDSRFRHSPDRRTRERGVTMALVAIAMVAIIAMAALSIDVVTLLLAREEAQRAADAGALAAARFISFSGLTGDPNNTSGIWTCVCGTPGPGCGSENGKPSLATLAAQNAAGQSTVSGAGGNSANVSITVTYSDVANSNTDCTVLAGPSSPFAVNPLVTVQVTRSSLPTFFSRMWGNSGNTVSATAIAEAFNPSNSGTVGNQVTGAITPVWPRCVKPWIVPNLDPLNPPGDTCTGQPGNLCQPFVSITDGSISNPGVSLDGSGTAGVIGERFTLMPDCNNHHFDFCSLHAGGHVQANYVNGSDIYVPAVPNLEYLPGQVSSSSVAVPGTAGDLYEQAVAGCDQTTVYQCGSATIPNYVDLSENPAQPFGNGDTMNAVMALIRQSSTDPTAQPSGQDQLSTYGIRTTDAPQILPGSSNPLGSNISGSFITASNSIVSLPIYDSNNNTISNNGGLNAVTIVGFLQVFINAVDQYGNVDVSVMNIAGCGNGRSGTPNPAVTGSSPVPIRLITPPVP